MDFEKLNEQKDTDQPQVEVQQTYINPIDYIEKIRLAYAEDEQEVVGKLKEKYGDNLVTLNQLEETVAYVIQTLSPVVLNNRTVIREILDILIGNGVSKDEAENLKETFELTDVEEDD